MCKTPRLAMRRPLLNLLTIALLLPAIAGFAHAAPESSLAVAPEASPVPASPVPAGQAAAPSPVASEGGGTALNWWSAPLGERLALALPDGEPSAASTRLGSAAEKVLDWETGAGKSYLIPALEVPGFLLLLNVFDRTVLSDRMREDKRTYSTNLSTTWEHLKRQNWHFDDNSFNVNQIGHPYQGATMYGLARSSGLGFWQSLAYSNAGSFLWEMAGETSRPSINDLITTGNSGSLLGEALFRMAGLVLKENGGRPDAWHELGAAALSPPTGFNRWAFGDRFKTLYPSHHPATFWRYRLGASLTGSSEQNAIMDFAISYGLPGKPGYSYTRPLDYFDFQIGGLTKSSNLLNHVLLRGLLNGKDYSRGEDLRGLWGLYGSYDYLSASDFRIANTALSLGTTAQYWAARDVALQGTALGGVGFGAAGVNLVGEGNRDFHYGVTPNALLALRLLFGQRASLELAGRGYYVSGLISDDSDNTEGIFRVNSGLTVRVYRRHALGFQYIKSIRDAHYKGQPHIHQNEGTLSLVYTFLGDSRFGSVEWRDLGNR